MKTSKDETVLSVDVFVLFRLLRQGAEVLVKNATSEPVGLGSNPDSFRITSLIQFLPSESNNRICLMRLLELNESNACKVLTTVSGM